MSDYTDLPLPPDETEVAGQVIAHFAQVDEDWEPAEGGIEETFAEAIATPIATAHTMLHLTARTAYMEVVGKHVAKIERAAARASTAFATVTLNTSAGLTLPAGTDFGLAKGSETHTFVNLSPLVYAPGSVTKTGVALVCIELGEESNGAGTPARCADSRVATVTITSNAEGGSEEEDEDAYIGRITDRGERLSFIPTTTPQYASLFREDEAIERVAWFNRYNPAAPGSDSPGHATFVCLDGDGDDFPLDGPVIARLAALPEIVGDDRPLQHVTHFRRAQYVALTIVLNITKDPDYGDQEVKDAVDAAVRAFMSKATWDYDRRATGRWRPTTKEITAFDAATAAASVVQTKRVKSATINGGASVSLVPGAGYPVALPNVVAVTVNVS